MEGHRSTSLCQKHKSAIWIGHPHLHIKPSLYVCRRVQGSQIFKQNWIILIRSRVIVILLIWVSSAMGVGQVGGGCPGWSTIIYMTSGMFRGKESSNRIEISRLVKDLLNFGVLGSLWLWGGGRWVGISGDIWGHGGVTTCMHTHTNACIEIANGRRHGGIHVYHACACMCLCICVNACVHGTPPTLPYPLTSGHLPPPQGTPRICQNSITLEVIKIFQFCLKIWNLWRIPHLRVGAWFGGQVGGWVGWWVGSGQIAKI